MRDTHRTEAGQLADNFAELNYRELAYLGEENHSLNDAETRMLAIGRRCEDARYEAFASPARWAEHSS